jgi:hypothetical protein
MGIIQTDWTTHALLLVVDLNCALEPCRLHLHQRSEVFRCKSSGVNGAKPGRHADEADALKEEQYSREVPGFGPNSLSKPLAELPGADVNVQLRSPGRESLLAVAVENRAVNMLRILLELGADPNSKDVAGEPLLVTTERTAHALPRGTSRAERCKVELMARCLRDAVHTWDAPGCAEARRAQRVQFCANRAAARWPAGDGLASTATAAEVAASVAQCGGRGAAGAASTG